MKAHFPKSWIVRPKEQAILNDLDRTVKDMKAIKLKMEQLFMSLAATELVLNGMEKKDTPATLATINGCISIDAEANAVKEIVEISADLENTEAVVGETVEIDLV